MRKVSIENCERDIVSYPPDSDSSVVSAIMDSVVVSDSSVTVADALTAPASYKIIIKYKYTVIFSFCNVKNCDVRNHLVTNSTSPPLLYSV